MRKNKYGKEIELLAPAGSYEKAIIAFKYGADAIYIGTPKISLRTKAKIEQEDLEKVVTYAHSHGKKVYAAINIYADDDQYADIIEQCKMLEKLKVDGIIAADGGIIETIKEHAPSIPINISTQANTISLPACKFWKNNGAKRVILGREINIENLKKIMKDKDDDLEVEIFIHGAICFAYSGRCYLSDFIVGEQASANKGKCAQLCRWNYNLYVENPKNKGELYPVMEDENGMTIFSSKDLCLIDELPEIVEMGIDSLKIEGRLKTENYLASIVNTYRCALDTILDGKEYDKDKFRAEIDKVKTRALTKFNFNIKSNDKIDEIQDLKGRQYNDKYQFGAIVDEKLENGMYRVYIKNQLKLGDNLEIIIPGVLEPIKFKIEKLVSVDTGEDIEVVNPGVKDQQVIMNIPVDAEKFYVIRKEI
ncbi:MAG: U32 family peptidase [Clostridiales bacterium]|nr:U32 family peptidase [Clostridiales bacterium]